MGLENAALFCSVDYLHLGKYQADCNVDVFEAKRKFYLFFLSSQRGHYPYPELLHFEKPLPICVSSVKI